MTRARLVGVGAGMAGWLCLAGPGLAADNEAGIPLTPAEAAGSWTVESAGHSVCVLRLGVKKVGAAGYAADVPSTCADALPPGVIAWAPAAGGMRLVGADGQPLIGFSRWSNSLFVSHRTSGVDIQLKRGAPSA
jgi:hypothetical protein